MTQTGGQHDNQCKCGRLLLGNLLYENQSKGRCRFKEMNRKLVVSVVKERGERNIAPPVLRVRMLSCSFHGQRGTSSNRVVQPKRSIVIGHSESNQIRGSGCKVIAASCAAGGRGLGFIGWIVNPGNSPLIFPMDHVLCKGRGKREQGRQYEGGTIFAQQIINYSPTDNELLSNRS